ncbi:MAG TPA: SufD family Fe-S cluster assembly protein, partial [Stellaceae bacterium]|nr:SufD family Fe-S cluster assembly protein [Stellaceae bacterium]
MTVVKTEAAPYLEAFRGRPAAGEPDWLAEKRRAALDRFAELGFPTRRDELWRFTNLNPLTRSAFLPAETAPSPDAAALAPYLLDGARHRIVLVNGRFAPALSAIGELPKGAWLGSTAAAMTAHPDWVRAAFEESDTIGAQPLASLNGAFFADGFVLVLGKGVVLDAPVEVIHLARAETPQAFHIRNVILAEAGSGAAIVETYAGSGTGWTNAVTRVAAGEGARIAHMKIQAEGDETIHTALTRGHLAAEVRYESFTLTTGARLSRNDSLIALTGDNAYLNLSGAYLLRGEQEATTATFVEHAALGGETREVFKGVMDERSHGVFLGKIAVRPGADKTDAHQLNRNLLLSRRASADTKPELEILADDVKCSHGATVGDL